MNIVTSKTREQFPLSRRKIWKKTVSSTWIWALILLGGFGLYLFVSSLPGTTQDATDIILIGFIERYFNLILGLIIGIILLVFVLTYVYQLWYFAVYYYDLTDDLVIIRKGPITPLEITIPYERIQDVYVSQSMLDRIFMIYDVHLSSASLDSGVEAHIHGVEKKAADGLRAMLLNKVKDRISKR